MPVLFSGTGSEIKDDKADYSSIAFDPYSDFMDPERESQW